MTLAWVWNHIDVRGPHECWPALQKDGNPTRGYGQLRMSHGAYVLHRLALAASGVTFPQSAHVCHRCDNYPCCNPEHLYAGDARTNALDKNRSDHYQHRRDFMPGGWRWYFHMEATP